jgi:putative colanic acid biosynthesis glycosyltransferase
MRRAIIIDGGQNRINFDGDFERHADSGAPPVVCKRMPLISVVTIVRNDRPGLVRTRTSIASQGFRDLEWLIIDGASTDGTTQYARSLDESYVSVLSEPDTGIFDAMNKGLERATSEFVLFLNAGDTLVNNAVLELVASRLRRGDVDFLYGDSLEAFGGDQLKYKVAKGHNRVTYGMFACHQTMFYRRSLIGAQRYDCRFRVSGDYAFTARFLIKKPRIERVDQALCIFDLAGTSVSNKRRGRKENWQVQRDVLELSLLRRCAIRVAYVCSALLANRLPVLYKMLRFRRINDN